METLDSEILALGLLESQRNRWLNFILFCFKAIWNSTLCPWFFSLSLSWSFHFLSLFLFLKCFLNYTLERLLSKVRNLVRVNSYRYFSLLTPAKISAFWWHRGRWKGSASPSPRFGVGHSCSTDSQAAGLLLHSCAGWARWCGEREMDRFLGFVKQIRRSRRRKGKKYRPEEDYHEGYEDVYYYASEHFRSKRLPSTLLLFLLACWGSQ